MVRLTRGQSGFTLIELLVGVVCVGLLAGVAGHFMGGKGSSVSDAATEEAAETNDAPEPGSAPLAAAAAAISPLSAAAAGASPAGSEGMGAPSSVTDAVSSATDSLHRKPMIDALLAAYLRNYDELLDSSSEALVAEKKSLLEQILPFAQSPRAEAGGFSEFATAFSRARTESLFAVDDLAAELSKLDPELMLPEMPSPMPSPTSSNSTSAPAASSSLTSAPPAAAPSPSRYELPAPPVLAGPSPLVAPPLE